MDENQTWQEMTDVFSSVFKKKVTLSPTTTAADIPEWDSLNHVKLIVAIESHFKVRFKNAQVASFENVGDLVRALLAARAGR